MSALQGSLFVGDGSGLQRDASQFRDHHQQRGALEIYGDAEDNVLGFDMQPHIGRQPTSRGSWKLKELYSLDAGSQKQNPLVSDTEVYVTF